MTWDTDNDYIGSCDDCGDRFQEDTLVTCQACGETVCVECWNHHDCED